MLKENIDVLKNILTKIENVRSEIIDLQSNLNDADTDSDGYELMLDTLDSDLESDLCNAIDTVKNLIDDIE
jgi:hypothetical protein